MREDKLEEKQIMFKVVDIFRDNNISPQCAMIIMSTLMISTCISIGITNEEFRGMVRALSNDYTRFKEASEEMA
jgi:hypothetical protein